MTLTHRFWALSALALTLVLGACSTPDDLNAPVLEPQFGTADEDRGVDVTFVSSGRIYSLSQETGPVYEEYEGSYYIGLTIKNAFEALRQQWQSHVDERS